MADEIPIGPEVPAGPAPPALSSEFVSYQRGLLNDAGWVQQFPRAAAALRLSLDNAVAAVGYVEPSQQDQRSPTERLFDQQYGLERSPAGEVLLPPAIATIVTRDVLSPPADASEARRVIEASGRDYDKVVVDAQRALTAAGSTAPAGIKVENLSAHSLAQLAIFGAHLRRREPAKT
jgi:hypothetical protein